MIWGTIISGHLHIQVWDCHSYFPGEESSIFFRCVFIAKLDWVSKLVDNTAIKSLLANGSKSPLLKIYHCKYFKNIFQGYVLNIGQVPSNQQKHHFHIWVLIEIRSIRNDHSEKSRRSIDFFLQLDLQELFGGFLKWGYPQMDGLKGKILLKWMI